MRLSGWGRFPVVECETRQPSDTTAAVSSLSAQTTAIARGNGRSYGDASLNPASTLDLRRLDRLIDFDAATGRLVCEGGVLLSSLLDIFLPRGWFVPVTPGTKLVTVGGMIACDVHGKNHHGAGSFCDHVDWIDLAIGEGRVLRCSATENADIFAATCGGMGLTGLILRVSFRLIPVETAAVRQRTVRAPNLAAAIELFEASQDWTYSVAWIDCLATGSNLGRSVVLLGEHAKRYQLPRERVDTPFLRPERKTKRVPVDFPAFSLSRPAVRAFNRLYYAAKTPGDAIVDIDPYFYPLDALRDWNRIYGSSGLIQYQCVLPLAESEAGLTRLLTEISARGQASFLAVLKRMGKQSFGMLSFPTEGYTLALDFPASTETLALLDRLDVITVEHGGRVYLAKDSRLGADTFSASYTRLEEFRAVRRRYELEDRFSSLLANRLDL